MSEPCPRCLPLAFNYVIRLEMVQPMPGDSPPLDNDGNPYCHDCNAAEALRRVTPSLTWEMARVAVGNDRQEQYRLPGIPMGLVKAGFVRPSEQGDLERHHKWLREKGFIE